MLSKKILWLLAALTIATLVLGACGPKPTEEATQAPSEGGFEIPAIEEGKFNVAMVLIGPHDDGGWSQAHYEGLEYIAENVPDVHTAYIENVYLVDEGAVYEVTAYPPPGYKLKRWIINFMDYAYGNPIYVELYVDAFIIAHFEPIPLSGGGAGRMQPPMLK